MLNKLKLVHINSNFDNFYLDFMAEQEKSDFKFRVFYPRNVDRGCPDISADYLDIRLNYNSLDRLFFYRKSRKIYNDFLSFYNNQIFDLIHAHTLFSNGYIAYKLNQEFGTPYVVAVRSMDLNFFLKYRPDMRYLALKILKNASAIIFLSNNYKEKLLNNYIPKNDRVSIDTKSFIIPNGINDFFLKNPNISKNFNDFKTINIITVGFISKRKNQISVCKAINNLVSNGYKIKYTIVGKILDKNEFRKISQYSFVNYIPFMQKEMLIKEYRKADIFVMPSLNETFGLTYVEAMTQGLPVIYTKGEGFDGYFEDGYVGYGVKDKEINEISKRIIDIVNNYSYFRNNAIMESEKFNWSHIEQEYEKIYNRIIK